MGVIDYSSKFIDRTERRARWQAVTGQTSTAYFDDGVEAEIFGGDVGAARICSVSHGRHRILCEESPARRSKQHLFKFVFQEEGECEFEQDGRAISLRAGEWCLYEKTQPHDIHNDGLCRQTALVVPYDSSHGDLARWETQLMRNYPTFEGAGHILHDSVTASVKELNSLSEASRYLVGKSLANLAEITLLDKIGLCNGVSPRDTLREKVIEHIHKHLNDPKLNIGSISAAMGCSKRYLHKIFADQGTTIAKLIWNCRLDRCYVDLSDTAISDTTITDIAYFWGFNDAQHFSRTFKARYGMTPRAFRVSGRID